MKDKSDLNNCTVFYTKPGIKSVQKTRARVELCGLTDRETYLIGSIKNEQLLRNTTSDSFRDYVLDMAKDRPWNMRYFPWLEHAFREAPERFKAEIMEIENILDKLPKINKERLAFNLYRGQKPVLFKNEIAPKEYQYITPDEMFA